jgi:hypothetical protein
LLPRIREIYFPGFYAFWLPSGLDLPDILTMRP